MLDSQCLQTPRLHSLLSRWSAALRALLMTGARLFSTARRLKSSAVSGRVVLVPLLIQPWPPFGLVAWTEMPRAPVTSDAVAVGVAHRRAIGFAGWRGRGRRRLWRDDGVGRRCRWGRCVRLGGCRCRLGVRSVDGVANDDGLLARGRRGTPAWRTVWRRRRRRGDANRARLSERGAFARRSSRRHGAIGRHSSCFGARRGVMERGTAGGRELARQPGPRCEQPDARGEAQGEPERPTTAPRPHEFEARLGEKKRWSGCEQRLRGRERRRRRSRRDAGSRRRSERDRLRCRRLREGGCRRPRFRRCQLRRGGTRRALIAGLTDRDDHARRDRRTGARERCRH